MRKGSVIAVLSLSVAAIAAPAVQAQLLARPAGASSAIDASAGNDTLQFYYNTPSPLNALSGDLDYGFLVSTERDIVGSAALLFSTGISPIPGLRLQVGPQAYAAKLNNGNSDVFAISAGATASFDLIRSLGVTAFGSAFYAPSVLIFGPSSKMYNFSVGATVRFIPSLYGMAGYRWMHFQLNNNIPSEDVQNEIFVGLRWVPGAQSTSQSASQ